MTIRKVFFKGRVVTLTLGEDNLWRDSEGTVYGFSDNGSSVDKVVRCGVGALSLPKESKLNRACAPHDYSHTSPAYQKFHTRSEADTDLYNKLRQSGASRVTALSMWLITRAVGWMYWENKDTRWK